MQTILKLLLFALFLYLMILGFYQLYKRLNEKITSSETLIGVIGFSLLLIGANLIFFGLGIYSFLKIYEFLSLPG